MFFVGFMIAMALVLAGAALALMVEPIVQIARRR